jgi:hypothetical protein
VISLFTIVAVTGIVSDQGGYFPTSWGWSTLAFLCVLGVWAVAAGSVDTGASDAIFMAALVLFTSWVGLSIAWSNNHAQSVLELERGLVLLAGCAAFFVLARREMLGSLTFALVLGITAISAYSLSTRLAPETFGVYDPFVVSDPAAADRLSAPLGYWNALGIFSVVGVLLALGLATQPDAGLATRATAAVALVLLPVTVYFTFSRGSWAALALGFAVTLTVSSARLRLVVESAALAIFPVAAIILASRSTALTDEHIDLTAATHQGHRLGLAMIVIAALAALSVWVVGRLEQHIRLSVYPRRALGGALLVTFLGAAAGAVVHLGGPVELVKRGYDSFVSAAPVSSAPNLNNRLFSLNGNGRVQLWRVALSADHGHWIAGTGAGSFERNWDQSLSATSIERDAHSLYIETLSELGVVGLVLLVVLLGTPLLAGLRARKVALVPGILGAYTAFLVHNAVDWDWELSGVALTGLFVASLLLAARRRSLERRIAPSIRVGVVLGAAAIGAFAVVVAVGNGALAQANTDNLDQQYAAAASEARLAREWMPWSPDPVLALGEAQLESGASASATASFRDAISLDPRDWQAWLELAASTHGSQQVKALARARSLYPRSSEIATAVSELRSP